MMRSIVALACGAAMAAGAAAQGPSDAQASTARAIPSWASPDSVIAAETARRSALLAADTTRLGRLVAGEFMEVSRLGTMRSRADNIGEIATGALRLTEIRYDSLSARVYGDVALLIGISDNAGTFRGMPFAGRVRYTRVFVHRDGRWQAIAMQQTPTP